MKLELSLRGTIPKLDECDFFLPTALYVIQRSLTNFKALPKILRNVSQSVGLRLYVATPS